MPPESFETYVAERGARLLRFAYHLTGSDIQRAEDLLQAALLRVWRRWDRGPAIENIDAYVRRVIARENFAHIRRRNLSEVLTARMPETQNSDAYAYSDSVDAVWRALAGLPKRQRAVLGLRYGEDLSDEEIASLLRVNASTVRSQAARGVATLRRLLIEQAYVRDGHANG